MEADIEGVELQDDVACATRRASAARDQPGEPTGFEQAEFAHHGFEAHLRLHEAGGGAQGDEAVRCARLRD